MGMVWVDFARLFCTGIKEEVRYKDLCARCLGEYLALCQLLRSEDRRSAGLLSHRKNNL